MERSNRPSLSEIFEALANEETSPDWDTQILREARQPDISTVRSVLAEGLPLPEAWDKLRYLEEE